MTTEADLPTEGGEGEMDTPTVEATQITQRAGKRKNKKRKKGRGDPLPGTTKNGGQRIYSSENPLVTKKDLDDFNIRCAEVYKKLDVEANQPEDVSLDYFGTRSLDVQTTQHYYASLRKFIKFLLSNPYFDESLVVFSPKTPAGTIAVQADAVRCFILAAFTPAGELVFDQNKQQVFFPHKEGTAAQPVLGIPGQRWKDPGNCNGFRAALEHIHCNHNGWKNIEYCELCPECCRLFESGDKGGCKKHPVRCNVRRGNVAKSTKVADTIAFINRTSDHETQGANILTPHDVRKIRDFCVAKKDRFYFSVFNIALVAIRLFMRNMEFLELSDQNFDTEAFAMGGPDIPIALYLSVLTKQKNTKENRPVGSRLGIRMRYLYLFRDNECPDLDPVRNLLGHLHCIGWRGGYLFPSQEEITNPPDDGIYKTHMSKDSLMSVLNHIYKEALGRDDKLGTHTFRKSGYLFGRIGGGKKEEIMLAADHTAYKVSDLYDRGTHAMAVLSEHDFSGVNKVGKFVNPSCIPSEAYKRINAVHKKHQKPLRQLADLFVVGVCGADSRGPNHRNPRHVTRVLDRWFQFSTPYETYNNIVSNFSGQAMRTLRGCVDHMIRLAREEGDRSGRNHERSYQRYNLLQAFARAIKRFEGRDQESVGTSETQLFLSLLECELLGTQKMKIQVFSDANPIGGTTEEMNRFTSLHDHTENMAIELSDTSEGINRFSTVDDISPPNTSPLEASPHTRNVSGHVSVTPPGLESDIPSTDSLCRIQRTLNLEDASQRSPPRQAELLPLGVGAAGETPPPAREPGEVQEAPAVAEPQGQLPADAAEPPEVDGEEAPMQLDSPHTNLGQSSHERVAENELQHPEPRKEAIEEQPSIITEAQPQQPEPAKQGMCAARSPIAPTIERGPSGLKTIVELQGQKNFIQWMQGLDNEQKCQFLLKYGKQDRKQFEKHWRPHFSKFVPFAACLRECCGGQTEPFVLLHRPPNGRIPWFSTWYNSYRLNHCPKHYLPTKEEKKEAKKNARKRKRNDAPG